MKIGRNDNCPCGSGKKYKHCHGKLNYGTKEINILSIINQNGYDTELATVIIKLLDVVNQKQWYGACHALSSILFIILSELNLNPIIYIGELRYGNIVFDHSWVEIDEKVIDIAIGFPQNIDIKCNPIVLDIDIKTLKNSTIDYKIINSIDSLDSVAKNIYESPISEYIIGYPNHPNLLLDTIVDISNKINRPISLDEIKNRYGKAYRKIRYI